MPRTRRRITRRRLAARLPPVQVMLPQQTQLILKQYKCAAHEGQAANLRASLQHLRCNDESAAECDCLLTGTSHRDVLANGLASLCYRVCRRRSGRRGRRGVPAEHGPPGGCPAVRQGTNPINLRRVCHQLGLIDLLQKAVSAACMQAHSVLQANIESTTAKIAPVCSGGASCRRQDMHAGSDHLSDPASVGFFWFICRPQ